MGILTKEQILNAKDLPTEIVSVPEWGGDVVVRTMTGTERDAFESSLISGKGKDAKENMENLRAKLISSCLVDEEGKRLFDAKDIAAIGGKSAKALDRIFEVAQRLNGIGDKEAEELSKN